MKQIAAFTILLALSLNVSAQKYILFKGDTINRSDKKGHRQGVWKKYYHTDTLIYSGYFKDNIPQGTFTYHFENGRVEATHHHYGDGKRSFFTSFYPNGRMQAQGLYLNKEKDSIWSYYNDMGALSATESYRNNKPNGTWYTYYTDTTSKVSEIDWDKGHKTGKWRLYYRNGKLKTYANMVDSNFVGEVKIYFPTGHIKIIGHYNNKGYADSTWTFYRETPEGEIDHTEEFRYGNSLNPPKELEEPLNDDEKPKK